MEKIYRLAGLDCPVCASKVERNVAKIKGVSDVNVDFMTTKIIIDFDDEPTEVLITKIKDTIIKVSDVTAVIE